MIFINNDMHGFCMDFMWLRFTLLKYKTFSLGRKWQSVSGYSTSQLTCGKHTGKTQKHIQQIVVVMVVPLLNEVKWSVESSSPIHVLPVPAFLTDQSSTDVGTLH
eukprot:scpid39498/ scgid20334/ 